MAPPTATEPQARAREASPDTPASIPPPWLPGFPWERSRLKLHVARPRLSKQDPKWGGFFGVVALARKWLAQMAQMAVSAGELKTFFPYFFLESNMDRNTRFFLAVAVAYFAYFGPCFRIGGGRGKLTAI